MSTIRTLVSRKTPLHRNPAEDNAPIVKYLLHLHINYDNGHDTARRIRKIYKRADGR